MSTNSGNSGVKNLRAMFENKASDQSTSPPSRGRSPNPSEISNNSRPVSKVRASFVAVERPSENGGAPLIGLRRASEVSSMGEIKETAIEDTESMKSSTPAVTTKKGEPTSDPQLAPSANDGTDEGGLGAILKGSAFVEHTPSKLAPEAKNLTEAIASGRIQDKIPRSPSKPKDESNAAEMVKKMQATEGTNPGPPPTTTLQTTKDAELVKPPPTRQQVNTKPIPRSPTVTRPSPRTPTSPKLHLRGGPAKIKGVMESAKEAQRAREAARLNAEKTEKTRASAPTKDTSARPRAAPESIKKEQTPATPKATRSPTAVKPKPPTVPGKLPAAATATTASTAAKHDTQHSPTEPERKSVKKTTTTSSTRQPRASSSASTFSLAKKASRTSLTNGHDRPKSRVSTAKPDESFLARMMRPTASSAQKVHEKVHVSSPPKHKSVAPNKVRQPSKEKTQPQTHVETPMTAEENKENYSDIDANTLPDVAHPSPLEVVKEDPMNGHAEEEPPAPEPMVPAQKVSGEADELD
ncbi:uncharacterized protein Z520_10979 [Fonsecaea multimorphosa CBS 102226]|uniref:Uncharacterized protein n=1 Tax=Fonsecaea multimorphosa CBS 102226 TaxID=1442371 RepID=A0A0D2I821_9EURO|nr:uncharacterized protein Z520_10979 [Fonsecaea multimorphosa CBS 102226]KIX93336.1 hypothetical protein Z520_10979 [Fonsecaea multimorphosa CBS 102226]OAL18573.1 hypothetical protein AYO22_10550 [Fonsecaea multimorphosa]